MIFYIYIKKIYIYYKIYNIKKLILISFNYKKYNINNIKTKFWKIILFIIILSPFITFLLFKIITYLLISYTKSYIHINCSCIIMMFNIYLINYYNNY